jgi:hypothetical protein
MLPGKWYRQADNANLFALCGCALAVIAVAHSSACATFGAGFVRGARYRGLFRPGGRRPAMILSLAMKGSAIIALALRLLRNGATLLEFDGQRNIGDRRCRRRQPAPLQALEPSYEHVHLKSLI